MDKDSISLRDFIYINDDMLYSYYSQVFEGVAEQIIESSSINDTTKNEQKGSPFKGEKIDEILTQIKSNTVSKVLFDHMYNKLETRLKDVIKSSSTINKDNIESELAKSCLLKVKGKAKIDDWDRLKTIMDNFNKLGQAIVNAQGLSANMQELLQQTNSITDRNEKARAKQKIKSMSDPVQNAKEKGLYQDPKLMESLSFTSNLFMPNGFEIIVTGTECDQDPIYRCIIDKRWLRISPDYLRMLYTGSVQFPITVVGQVTFVNKPKPTKGEDNISETANNVTDEEKSSICDSYRNMFESAKEVERVFLHSQTRPEIIIAPIAVYKEIYEG